MWIVKLALARPYTFIVFSLVLLLICPVVLLRTPVDIFPSIDIPVISVIWTYTGLVPSEMETRIVSIFERSLTTSVNNIEHIESQSFNGVAVVKVFLQPTADINGAISEVIAEAQVGLKQFPPGITPPLVLSYDASSVPILQLGLSGKGLSEQQLNDLGVNFIRPQLATIQGASVPIPYGGKVRQVMVDIDSQQLMAKGLSPLDVVNAVNAQNVILPSGTAKIGRTEYNVGLNGTPSIVDALNRIPVKVVNGGTLYIQDVAHVRDGYAVQQNIVRQNGQRGVLLTVQKSGNASTLSIVSDIYKILPKIKATLPPQLVITPQFDQSLFVRASLQGVGREGAIAALLTSMMILLFLGSWRATLIIVVSIPLSILTSLLILSALGQTINIMTLGGLALAVGVLVDDATVEIENFERQLAMGKEPHQAILDAANQIAVPAFVSTLAISIVFVPMFFLTGVARYLFVPLAEAVVFALMASYFFSRTLVPTLEMYLLSKEAAKYQHPEQEKSRGIFARLHQMFENGFEALRRGYSELLELCLRHRGWFAGGFLLFCLASLLLVSHLGQDFFPTVDAGQIRLHLRAKTGTRIENTARLTSEAEDVIRRVIPAAELVGVIDNIGLPTSGINLSYSNSETVGNFDAEILISLQAKHHPTAGYVKTLREELPRDFPSTGFFFEPADIVTQILNFGLPAPIDIQLIGSDMAHNYSLAAKMVNQIRSVPGAVDVHVHQLLDQPRLNFAVDRVRTQQVGLSERDIAGNVLVALSSSFQTAPNFWLSPNGVSYPIAIQTPQYKVDSIDALRTIPVNSPQAQRPQLLENLSSIDRRQEPADVSHYNVQRTIDIYAGTQGRDLGGVASDISKITVAARKELPKGSTMVVRGQVATMRSSFLGLGAGLAFAIVLVYSLIVVNFQSWSEAFIIITALPAALAGICWMLYLTNTTLSVPALMGTIMSMGVATANSVLIISFANERFAETKDALAAALEAGSTRLRPVIMTALAMIIGMVPMAIGMGEGGEQNAPLGRAVIGGLLFATSATLFFVPTVFAIVRHQKTIRMLEDAMKQNTVTRKNISGKRLLWFLLIPVLLGTSAFFSAQARLKTSRELQTATNSLEVQTVSVIHPQRGASSSDLTLPGMIQAFSQSPVYARVDGYVRMWYADIGAHVTKGQLLAEIDAPEVDQQLNQARAVLKQNEANLALAQVTAPRYQELIKSNSVSQQEVDQNNQNLAAQTANVQAAQAAVSRLEQMQGFEKIVAPFDGVVTSRQTDFGDLVNSGNGGVGREMFRISQNNIVRVFVTVPEEFSKQVRAGTKASMDLVELPNRHFAASVTRTTDAIDADSRTLTVELDVPNQSGALLPGAYANVHFQLSLGVAPLAVPSSTILFQEDGPQVGLVNGRNQVELRKVTLGHDFGDTIQIVSGVRASDAVIANPADSLTNGMQVTVQGASASTKGN